MTDQGNDVANWAVYTLGGGGGLTFMLYMLRRMFLGVSSDMLAATQNAAAASVVTTLREEVARLEVLVQKMQASIDSHTQKINRLESQVMRNRSAAIAALALVETFSCECSENEPARSKLIAILHRMSEPEEIT